MSKPLDELYFQWLYSQVADPRITRKDRTVWRVLKLLYTREFVWFVPNDDNRLEDGKDLRYEFIDEAGLQDVDQGWVDLGCSVLELLVGLSRKLAFEAEGRPALWFWQMMTNIGLADYDDRRNYSDTEIEQVLDRVIFRTYDHNGAGGLFPLKEAKQDQRKVELWYQMSAYVLELI
jgi:hypothetical protein